MNKSDFSVAVFPFLKTSSSIEIDEYVFRSTNDLEGLPTEQAKAVTELTAMLYLRDDIKIACATYAIAQPLGVMRPGPIAQRLHRIRTVIGYLYSSPHPVLGDVFLPLENTSLMIVSPDKVSIHLVRPQHGTVATAAKAPSDDKTDAFGYMPGYEGVFDLRQSMWLAADSRVYGQKQNMFLNISQDIASQLGNEASLPGTSTQLLFSLLKSPDSPFSERIVTALGWYNDANERDIDPGKSLLCLAIAFEALLELPRDGKTERVVDAISLLLGRIERISLWAKQFYEARSQVVHEGRVRDWNFYTQPPMGKRSGDRKLGSVLTYSRQVFQLCLKTILTGAALAESAGLKERFISNSERYADLTAVLLRCDENPSNKILTIAPIIDKLREYEFAGARMAIQDVLMAINAAATTLLQCNPKISNELQEALDIFAKIPHKQTFDCLQALDKLEGSFRKDGNNFMDDCVRTISTLVEIAWRSLGPTYFYMAEACQKKIYLD